MACALLFLNIIQRIVQYLHVKYSNHNNKWWGREYNNNNNNKIQNCVLSAHAGVDIM